MAKTLGNINAGYGNTLGTGTTKSSIVGGQSNNISDSSRSFIGGGTSNNIDKLNIGEISSVGNIIGGGFDNHIYNGGYSTIVGGNQNYINGGGYNHSVIGGGKENTISTYNEQSVIVGGRLNQISSTGYKGNQFIGGGYSNQIVGYSYGGANVIVGGGSDANFPASNIINGGSNNFIGGGAYTDNNIISGSSYNNAIVAGEGNIINSNADSFIGGGNGNQIRQIRSSIVGGQSNTILERLSFIGGGSNNTINAFRYSSILGGQSNTVNHQNAHIIGSNITSIEANATHTETIVVNDGDVVKSSVGGGELNLNDSFGPDGTWSITSDNGGYGSGSTWVYGQVGNGSQLSYQKDASEAIGFGVYSSDVGEPLISTAKEVVIIDNEVSSKSSGNMDKRAVFIGTRNSTINSGLTNTVVIGGVGITATQDDTVYVDNLNIGTIGSGTPQINLGVDAIGNVVTGTTPQSFTGNTSGDCITDLYVTNLYGCSPLHIEPTGLNDVYITENGGNVGVGRAPEKKLDVLGETRLSGGGQNILTVIGSGSTSPLFTVEGSQGELLTVTDDTDLSILRVNNSATNPVLDVLDDDTIMMGNYLSPSLNTTTKISPSTGLTNVYSLPVSAHTGAWFDYTVINTTGARAGQIMSIFSGSTVQFTENATSDIGSTTPVTFTMSSDGANATLQVSATTTGWEVKTIIRSI